jgi:hypothetical protein
MPSDSLTTAHASPQDKAVLEAYNSALARTQSLFGAMAAAEGVFRRQHRGVPDRQARYTVALIVSSAAPKQRRTRKSAKTAQPASDATSARPHASAGGEPEPQAHRLWRTAVREES